MFDERNDKSVRVLQIYTELLNGKTVYKNELANKYNVAPRSIQRDIDEIRNYLENNQKSGGVTNTVIYDYNEKGYRLVHLNKTTLSDGELLAICKIILDSRAFQKKELHGVLGKIIDGCASEESKKIILELIKNEEFHYVELRHKTSVSDILWELGQAVRENKYIEIDYFRTKDKSIVNRKLKPVAVMFSEYYFYLAAFIEDNEVRKDFDVLNDSFPTIYRLDRIKKLTVFKEKFHIPYKDKFEEGEFRKRIQFMQGGKLHKIKFRYSGLDIDAVLDRLPTAQVLSENNGIYTVTAEVFGKGIDMWIRSQGDSVCLLENNDI